MRGNENTGLTDLLALKDYTKKTLLDLDTFIENR